MPNLKLLTATHWASVAFMVALMMTREAEFELFNKFVKYGERIARK